MQPVYRKSVGRGDEQGQRRDWHPGEEQLQGVLTTGGEAQMALTAKAEGKAEGNKT